MANEVIVEEYSGVTLKNPDGRYAPVPGILLTTQVLTIGVLSAAFDARTAFLRIQSKGTGFWYKIGGAAPSAVADTAGNRWLPADDHRDISIDIGTDTKIDTAA